MDVCNRNTKLTVHNFYSICEVNIFHIKCITYKTAVFWDNIIVDTLPLKPDDGQSQGCPVEKVKKFSNTLGLVNEPYLHPCTSVPFNIGL